MSDDRSLSSEVQSLKSEVLSPKSVIRNLTSEVRSPKSKVLSPRSEVLNPKLEVRSPKSDVLFLSVSARKATSLCVAYLSRLSAFDQETRHFQNCRLNVKRQLADSHLCRTARHMPPLMRQVQACRQHHLQNRTDPTKIGLPIYTLSSDSSTISLV